MSEKISEFKYPVERHINLNKNGWYSTTGSFIVCPIKEINECAKYILDYGNGPKYFKDKYERGDIFGNKNKILSFDDFIKGKTSSEILSYFRYIKIENSGIQFPRLLSSTQYLELKNKGVVIPENLDINPITKFNLDEARDQNKILEFSENNDEFIKLTNKFLDDPFLGIQSTDYEMMKKVCKYLGFKEIEKILGRELDIQKDNHKIIYGLSQDNILAVVLDIWNNPDSDYSKDGYIYGLNVEVVEDIQ